MKRLLALLMILAVAACGDDGTGPDGGNGDGSEFDITVSSGINPTYSWSGGTAFSVSITRTSAPGTIVWGVASPPMTIASPVTHGSTPATGVVTAATETSLTAGVQYRVSITRQDQKSGFKSFTPAP